MRRVYLVGNRRQNLVPASEFSFKAFQKLLKAPKALKLESLQSGQAGRDLYEKQIIHDANVITYNRAAS
jgi:hypothetical protein